METRVSQEAFRTLSRQQSQVDFSSNDYLGFAKSEALFDRVHQHLVSKKLKLNGATGSRLLSGNHDLYPQTEKFLCDFYHSEAALIFNSGYDANVGFFASVPQKGDYILYDEYIHASIRDGIRMCLAKSHKFKHNDLQELDILVKRLPKDTTIYVVTESVFSMDGDSPNLLMLSKYCDENKLFLVVDEAHAVGVFGNGLCVATGILDQTFARIVTFGKAFGSHGAAILGSNELKEYLVNFARSFIYTTGLPPHAIATINEAHHLLQESEVAAVLGKRIDYFLQTKEKLSLDTLFVPSCSAVQCAVIPGNIKVKNIATELQDKGFEVKPILSPTVPEGQERLRFCLHSYNSELEISEVLQLLATFVKNEG